jgi:hypothetical protein
MYKRGKSRNISSKLNQRKKSVRLNPHKAGCGYHQNEYSMKRMFGFRKIFLDTNNTVYVLPLN